MSELIDKDAFLKQERKWYCENCDRRKGVKNGRKCFVYEIGEVPCRACDVDDVLDDLECFETIDASPWNRVEEELPKVGTNCLVGWKHDDGFYYEDSVYGYGADGLGFWCRKAEHDQMVEPDYWMPIEPPKEDE